MIALAQVGHECPYSASPYSREVAALLRYHCAPRNDARVGKQTHPAQAQSYRTPSEEGKPKGLG